MSVLMTAKEISEELGISKTLAYQIMEKLNKELEAKGFFVIKGKVSRRYLSEQIYGMPEKDYVKKENANGSLQRQTKRNVVCFGLLHKLER